MLTADDLAAMRADAENGQGYRKLVFSGTSTFEARKSAADALSRCPGYVVALLAEVERLQDIQRRSVDAIEAEARALDQTGYDWMQRKAVGMWRTVQIVKEVAGLPESPP